MANDPDFESQVEAHFGIKPKHDMHKSRFIGGSSSMIDINPVVNQNLGSGSSMSNEVVLILSLLQILMVLLLVFIVVLQFWTMSM